MDFHRTPVLIFWETTRACPLACIHCRASALSDPLPGEMNTHEAMRFMDSILEFEEPRPTLIFTGGDPLKRKDLFLLLEYAKKRGIRTGLSPAVSELLTSNVFEKVKELNVSSVSISLDAPVANLHDEIRRRQGTFVRTIESIRLALSLGINIQVNTVVMRHNFSLLPEIFHLIKEIGVKTWEVFFLVRVGRGIDVEDITPEEYESACNFLYDASMYDVVIRTVEAPFIRRVARVRAEKGEYWTGRDYVQMREKLLKYEGPPTSNSTIATRGTLDGDGIIFVGYDGSVYPGGLLPYMLGSVKEQKIARIYRESETLRRIRERELKGYCGICEYKSICGGSRARAYSFTADPLESDPACIQVSAIARQN
ncbi:MAG: TIGR04053 family radical SAM/SPASM domain-containing protein [Conexivisphaerales archaeon]